ncbi:MAG: hypothetical protein JWO02_4507 [Solirubrobacterales bacterium]|nr:hypothetical protein [Solirubrobacterales bacterium]
MIALPGRWRHAVRRAALAPAAVGVLLIAGCGTDSGGPSKAAYAAKADQICADGNRAVKGFSKQIEAAQRGADPAEVFRELANLTREASDASQPYLDKLDALGTPNADRDALKGWIADQRRQQSLLAELGDAFEQRDEATISTLSQRIDALNTKNNTFAAKYGMAECAATPA